MGSVKLIGFCALCFADENGGSWGETADPQTMFCSNCCANGSIIMIPEWAVKSIREQASWVGKRYYPNKEDIEHTEEREALLKLVETFPGREAYQLSDGRWEVNQKLPEGSVMTWVSSALNPMDAMRKSRLRYIPAEPN